MQTQPTSTAPRYLALSPAAMSVALAVLAFLKGLFAAPLILIAHEHMSKWGGWNRGSMGGGMPGPMPGGPMPGGPPPYPGGMPGHHMMSMFMWHSPWLLLALWLASIVAAGIAGAILAVVYNYVVGRMAIPRL